MNKMLMFRCSRSLRSSFRMAFCVDTSRAEVGSSAISILGFNSVEMAITARCFMPPLSSNGYISSTFLSSPTSSNLSVDILTISSSEYLPGLCSSTTSFMKSMIFLVGFNAFMELWGTIEMSFPLTFFLSSLSGISKMFVPSIITLPPMT